MPLTCAHSATLMPTLSLQCSYTSPLIHWRLSQSLPSVANHDTAFASLISLSHHPLRPCPIYKLGFPSVPCEAPSTAAVLGAK